MKKVTLNELYNTDNGVFTDGDWVESKDQDPNGEVRLIQLADIGDGIFLNKSNRFLTYDKAIALKCTFLSPGDILIARMPDPLGRACIFPDLGIPCVTVVDVCIFRPDKEIVDNDWLKFNINSISFRNKIRPFISGTTRKRISRRNLAKIKFTLPSLSEQRRIAALLTKAEILIQQRKESLALADEFLKFKFLEMFGDPVRRNPNFPFLAIKKVAKVRIGPFGSLLHKEEYVENGTPLINPSHISGGKIVPDWNLTVADVKKNELGSYILDEGDIILGRRGEIGRCAVVSEKEKGWICGTGSIFIRPSQDLDPQYLQFAISSESGRKILTDRAKGITMKNLNSKVVENLFISVPPIDFQDQFTQIVQQVEKLKIEYQNSLNELKELFASLSQKAFKGELEFNSDFQVEEQIIIKEHAPEAKEEPEVIPEQKIERNEVLVSDTTDYKPVYDDVLNVINRQFQNQFFTFEDLKEATKKEGWKYDFETLKDFVFQLIREQKLQQVFIDSAFKAQFEKTDPDYETVQEIKEERIYFKKLTTQS